LFVHSCHLLWADGPRLFYVLHKTFEPVQAFDQTVRRQIQEAMKAQERRYRAQREEIGRLPKSEQRNALKKLKEERTRNMATLAQQYEDTISENVELKQVIIFISCSRMNCLIRYTRSFCGASCN
jgi:hypothetical protein